MSLVKSLAEKKFSQKKFKAELLKTGKAQLKHNVKNGFWGLGPDGKGLNTMGKILMEIRENLTIAGGIDETADVKDVSHEPEVIILGNSHFKKFDRKQVHGIKMSHEATYTIADAQRYINSNKLPETTILHLITNDVKNGMSVAECVTKMYELISEIRQKHNTKVVVSLGVPSLTRGLNDDILTVAAILEADESLQTINHETSFTYGDKVNTRLFEDPIHPNREGLKRLVSNIKAKIL